MTILMHTSLIHLCSPLLRKSSFGKIIHETRNLHQCDLFRGESTRWKFSLKTVKAIEISVSQVSVKNLVKVHFHSVKSMGDVLFNIMEGSIQNHACGEGRGSWKPESLSDRFPWGAGCKTLDIASEKPQAGKRDRGVNTQHSPALLRSFPFMSFCHGASGNKGTRCLPVKGSDRRRSEGLCRAKQAWIWCSCQQQ